MALVACSAIGACGSDSPATSAEPDPSSSTAVATSRSTDAVSTTIAADDQPIGTWTFASSASNVPETPTPRGGFFHACERIHRVVEVTTTSALGGPLRSGVLSQAQYTMSSA